MEFMVALVCLLLVAGPVRADEHHLPMDFNVPGVTWGGAGGGHDRSDRADLKHLPVILIADRGRTHTDWTGDHPGDLPPGTHGNVYAALREAGFAPIELWMPDFAGPFDTMSSIEEATDDLKFFIARVLQYTGAPKVQLVAHGGGAILARLTLIKYNIAHWVAAEVYIDAPFHGVTGGPAGAPALAGEPNAWVVQVGSELLHEVLLSGETPAFVEPVTDTPFGLPTLTLRSGEPGAAGWYPDNPDSPTLFGARNEILPGLSHDALRTHPCARALFIPFLDRESSPYNPTQDRDGDGCADVRFGGSDCNDQDPAIYPGAREIPTDGVDQDCNGREFHPRFRRDGELPL